MFGLYGALLRLAWAAVLPYQVVISLFTGAPRPRLGERLGWAGALEGIASGGLWLHAVSVGEVRLALALISRLRAIDPTRPIHLTTTTATGRSLVTDALESRRPGRPDSVSAFPLDLAGPLDRFLSRLRPAAIVLIETEIWPNLLRAAGRRGIPIVLVNGRISPRAYPRYRLIQSLLRIVLQEVLLFGMQSEADAGRIRSLGAPDDRVRVTGNLKFDLPPPHVEAGAVRLRLGLDDKSLVFVAGSTAPGEEGPVLEAFSMLRRDWPEARLVVAPRHPQDRARHESAITQAGLRLAVWSRLDPDRRAPGCLAYDALLIDTVGVLPDVYGVADVVFVGGSLVTRGGQNILEPAALGKPVIFGPHMDNFRAAADALIEAGAGFVVHDGRELGRLALRLLSDREAYDAASAMARDVVLKNRGAMNRTLELIEEVVTPPRAPQRSTAVSS